MNRTRTTRRTGSREEAINTVAANLLTEDHLLRTVPEQRIHGRSKVPDLTIRPTLECPHMIFGEAKIGTGATEKTAAARQAREWTTTQPRNAPKRLAFAVCYPTTIRDDLTPGEIATRLRETKRLEWAFFERGTHTPTWRVGRLRELATEVRNVSEHQGDLETLLTGIIVEAANLWVHHRERAIHAVAEALNVRPAKAGDDRNLRIATVMLANGCLLDKRLESSWENEHEPLPPVTATESLQTCLIRRWDAILEVDYAPIFEPALACLRSLPPGLETESTLDTLRCAADSCANALGALEYDVAGPIYHRLLDSARYDGSFYTTPPAAMLLARLALAHVDCDWSNPEAIARLRIMDPACGTGTLLLAVQHAIRDLHIAHLRSRDLESLDLIHLDLVQQVLHGVDINRHAVQLAACNLTLSSPRIDYHRMPLYTAKHGLVRNEDGQRAWTGSIELLLQDQDRGQVPLALGEARAETAVTTGREESESERFTRELGNPFDLVIMNPPFTRNDIRNRQLDRAARNRVQQREIEIAEQLAAHDADAAAAIDQSSIRTFFTPLADKMLKKNQRTLAKVMPATAIGSPAGQRERELLATRFQIETVVTSHDRSRIYFSGNTDIHESLIVGTAARSEPKPTRFIQLRRNPLNKAEALALESCIRRREGLEDWGRETEWPAAKMRRGDWSAALFYDSVLLEALDELHALLGTRLQPLGEMAHVGPEGRRCRDAFPSKKPRRGPYALLWQHETDRQRTIRTTPDRRIRPKRAKARYAEERLWPMAGELLIGNKLRMNLTRTPAVWTGEPTLGSAWCPVRSRRNERDSDERAWAAWLNSTPGILGFLARRTKNLTYSAFPLANLRAIPCPDPSQVDLTPLVDAFARLHDSELAPLPQMADDPVRAELDAAASRVARLNGRVVRTWREAIAREPTVRG